MKHLIEPKVHIFLKKDNKILFLKRFNTGCYDGYWCLPSGRIEKGESPLHAAKRETLEEVGLNIDLVFVATVYAKIFDILISSSDSYEDLCFFFSGSTKQNPINAEPNKHDQIGWFPLNNLPLPIMPVTKFGIDCYVKNLSYGEFGY